MHSKSIASRFADQEFPDPDAAMTGERRIVYLLQGHDMYKIGITTNLRKRVIAIQSHSPVPIEVVYWVIAERGRDLEIGLHDLFDAQHSHGEWFELSLEQRATAMDLMDLWGDDPSPTFKTHFPALDARIRTNLSQITVHKRKFADFRARPKPKPRRRDKRGRWKR